MGLFNNSPRANAAAARKQNRRVQQARPRPVPAPTPVARKPAVTASRAGSRVNRRVDAPRAGAKPAIHVPRAGLKNLVAAVPRVGARGRRLFSLAARLAIAVSLAWGVLLAVQASYQFVTTSARFEAKSLVYQATPHVPVDRLQSLLGLEPGTNILAVDTDALQAKIAAEPWVKRASVQRSLPDTLIVEVEEHEAAAALLSGYFYLIDRDGVPFKRLEEGERGELPVITGVDREQLVAGDARAQSAIRRGLDALTAYQQAARPRLSEVHVDQGGAVELYTAKTGAALRLGRGDVAAKLARFDALRAALGERAEQLAVVHLDLDAAPGTPERVVASFLDAEAEAAVLARGAGAHKPASKDIAQEPAAAAPPASGPSKPAKSKGKKKKAASGNKFASGIPKYD
ncbi:FtsQ-type POTRA domain-containing protein [Nannocystis sp. RBIL2]|uniref:cell division protein FtsQ/DivIB n=1 Tax=Nannocystis sp. RBIL2 TaxID=2996788 RepID=UPI00226FA635|nr:FtsQ-type POTRA domain-containing protein [Nannocystis sp. RBIL2]MCY1066451.1 FtsQ-type POTRA domain-containing protein [Nannocystis sp. RBIL2]